MSTREAILAAVRAGLGGRAVDEQRVRAEAAALLDGAEATRPILPEGGLVDAFAARLVSPKVCATVDRIQHVAELPAAVRRYLDEKSLPHAIALQPVRELSALNWEGFDVRTAPDPEATTGVGTARWGIAETGSLVFHSGADTPILANFLPLHHLVLVQAAHVVPYLEDYALKRERKQPRNVNIITGASGTTDIEGSLVRGAHGPRYLHVVIAG